MTADRGDHGDRPDLDLLADYAAGLLEGTPQGMQVAAHIASDPAWSQLYRELLASQDAVRSELAALPPEPLPADVARRLDAALAREERPLPQVARSPARVVPAATVVHAATVVPFRRRWVLTGAVAASIVALAAGAVGITALTGSNGGRTTTATSPQEGDVGAMDSSGAGGQGAALPMVTTGTNYSANDLGIQVRQTLATVATQTRIPTSASSSDRQNEHQDPSAPAPAPGVSGLSTPGAVPDALRRLTDAGALQACLAALGGAERPLAVDYAHYNGVPAVVVVFPGKTDRVFDVVVAGSRCGLTRSDELLRTTIEPSR